MHKVGEDSPHLQQQIRGLIKDTKRLLSELADDWESHEVAVAALLTAVGNTVGELSVAYNEHGKECAACAKKTPPWRELAISNFTAGYEQGKAIIETRVAESAAEADSLLDRIVKGQKHE